MFEIGNTLREARVRRGLTLQQAEEDTKIRVKYVQALENEDWDVLPGATYVKGFLRIYAVYLGLDPGTMIDEYRSRALMPGVERSEPFGGASMLGKPRSRRGRNTIVFIAVICLMVLGIIFVLGIYSGDDGTPPTTQPGALGIDSTSPTPRPTQSAKPPERVKPGLHNVVNVAANDGDCWMEVRRDDAEGAVLFSGTLSDGERESFKGKVLWLTLGNPSAVRLTIEGKKKPRLEGASPVVVVVKKGKLQKQD